MSFLDYSRIQLKELSLVVKDFLTMIFQAFLWPLFMYKVSKKQNFFSESFHLVLGAFMVYPLFSEVFLHGSTIWVMLIDCIVFFLFVHVADYREWKKKKEIKHD